MKTKDLIYVGLCCAVLTVCAYITVPYAVPFTMQTFGVFLTVGLLGKKKGSAAILVYIILGCIGIPVFSGMRGGISVLLSNTGGYIAGFLIGGYISGLLIEKTGKLLIPMCIGNLVCYVFGSIWYFAVYTKNTGAVSLVWVLMTCVVPYIIPDFVKICLAAYMTKKLKPHIKL